MLVSLPLFSFLYSSMDERMIIMFMSLYSTILLASSEEVNLKNFYIYIDYQSAGLGKHLLDQYHHFTGDKTRSHVS